LQLESTMSLLQFMARASHWLSLVLLLVAQASAAAEQARPRIGLVLSGGGARGAAHVGVLKVLDEMRIPVDAVAGTSMGAVFGGLYSSGMSGAEVEELLQSVNWRDAFRDRPPRDQLGYRRKQDDRNFLVRYSLGLRADGVVLPRGLVQGQKLEQVLRNATLPVAEVRNFDRLPIPFRAIATDLESGQPVYMASGDLVTAMRSSLSAPGVFEPVQRDGRLLVDGGLVDNLPIDIARSMNVDILIVVDVSFPLFLRDELDSPLDVTNQAFAIMIRSRTLEQRAKLHADDIIIEPSLGRFNSADFSRLPQALRAGEQAARLLAGKLRPLSLSAGDYLQYLAQRNPRELSTPQVDFVTVTAESRQYAGLVQARMSDLQGKPLDQKVVNRRLSSLYALDLFESIDYNLVEAEGRSGLELSLRRKRSGPNYLRVGLNLEDDFEGNSRYNAALRLIMTELNSGGAEWLTDLQVGDNLRLFTELYQPWSLASRYFVAPRVEAQERSVFTRRGVDRVGEFRVRTLESGLDLGRELSNWGEIRLGLQRGIGRSRVLIGDESLPTDEFQRGGFFLRFAYDKLDNISFPRRGQLFEFESRWERSGLGSDQNFETYSANWLIARSLGRNTLLFSTDFGTTSDDLTTPENFFSLGGFFNLSGLPPGFLSGPHFAVARLIYYRQIGRGGSGVLDFPAYIGASVEAGNVWRDRKDASLGGLRKDASLFFGVDSPLGPVYIGAGFDEGGQRAFYLFLGRTF
jgi:NTE family protein